MNNFTKLNSKSVIGVRDELPNMPTNRHRSFLVKYFNQLKFKRKKDMIDEFNRLSSANKLNLANDLQKMFPDIINEGDSLNNSAVLSLIWWISGNIPDDDTNPNSHVDESTKSKEYDIQVGLDDLTNGDDSMEMNFSNRLNNIYNTIYNFGILRDKDITNYIYDNSDNPDEQEAIEYVVENYLGGRDFHTKEELLSAIRELPESVKKQIIKDLGNKVPSTFKKILIGSGIAAVGAVGVGLASYLLYKKLKNRKSNSGASFQPPPSPPPSAASKNPGIFTSKPINKKNSRSVSTPKNKTGNVRHSPGKTGQNVMNKKHKHKSRH